MDIANAFAKKHASQEIKERIAVKQRGVGGITKGATVTYTLSDGKKKIQKVTDVVNGHGISGAGGEFSASVGVAGTRR